MANVITIRWADEHLKKYGRKLAELNVRFPKVIPQEINKVGNKAKTQVIRNLTKQTGLPRKTIVKAVKTTLAGGQRYSYDMVTRGGNIRLKYLKPVETRPGVVAKPWGKATLFPGSFMKGGKFPRRKIVAKFNGHVYRRLNPSGTHITQVRSGMYIPAEMTTGATREAFERIAGPLLQQRINAAIRKLVP